MQFISESIGHKTVNNWVAVQGNSWERSSEDGV